MWTPVHFWALAFLVKDQYAAVGVPMAPTVLGTQGTLRQMLLYTLLTVLTSLVPLVLDEAGWLYGGTATLLNVLLLSKMLRLYRKVGPAQEVTREDSLSPVQILNALPGAGLSLPGPGPEFALSALADPPATRQTVAPVRCAQ